MARAPFAVWVGPSPNRVAGGMRRPVKGLVLHITVGGVEGAQSWLKNPKSRASAHFLNPKIGSLRQLVDTDDRAWAQGSGNLNWVSVENEGKEGDSLTGSQIANVVMLLRWLHNTEGVPIQLSDNPGVGGLGWHGMGKQAWGSHPNCPGDAIVRQRPQIIRLALAVTDPHTPPPGMAWEYQEAEVRTTLVQIGPLDKKGRGYADWNPGLGRDPIPVGLVKQGSDPAAGSSDDKGGDPYWEKQGAVDTDYDVKASPRGGALRVVVTGGVEGQTVGVYATVA